VLRIIIEYYTLKGFCPLKLGEMIDSNLVVRNSHSSLDFCFLCHLLKCAPGPKWLCHLSIIHKSKSETIFSKAGYATHHTENSCNSFKMWQCDWKHSNTHVMTSLLLLLLLLFWFEILSKYEKEIFDHFLFGEKSH
jgi:hypothetical protein